MPHFRTRLTLDSLDDRTVPSAVTPPDPGNGPPANMAENASPYVTINTTGMSHATQLLIRVQNDDGSYISVFVDIPPGTNAPTAAGLIASALQAEGLRVDVNGNLVTVWGSAGGDVESVDAQVVGSDLGRDNPAINPPAVNGNNGAIGSSSVSIASVEVE